jgi:predicted metal-dependent hydrolase
VHFEFNRGPDARFFPGEFLAVSGREIPLALVRNLRARRYVLRLRADGSARVTIPRRGSAAEARRFVERNRNWLEHQLQRLAAQPVRPREWLIGTEILFRGEFVKLQAGVNGETGLVLFADQKLKSPGNSADLRVSIERHLWSLAATELPPKVFEFATAHGLDVRCVTVRNQRSRWGSCSRRGTISLNWRLIQASAFVRDYIILHELMHLRQMNHSAHFWREVESVCPDYRHAESWLKKHSSILR